MMFTFPLALSFRSFTISFLRLHVEIYGHEVSRVGLYVDHLLVRVPIPVTSSSHKLRVYQYHSLDVKPMPNVLLAE